MTVALLKLFSPPLDTEGLVWRSGGDQSLSVPARGPEQDQRAGARMPRKRFGRYEMIDFLAVLLGYAISGERTSDKQTGGLVDRAGKTWIVFDIDGTRDAARQRALPQSDELPPPFRRLDDVCASGYRGRKRGEVVRTRTTVSQAHSYRWLGSFGAPLAMGDIGKNCARGLLPLAGIFQRGGGNASCGQKEESRWRDAGRGGLRTVLHKPPTTRLHCLRCCRAVPASWRL
jgi:hypothetical protein